MPLAPATQIRLESQLDALPQLIAPLKNTELRRRPIPDKWSIFEHMAHLARYQEIFVQRLDRIMIDELPGLSAYQAERDIAWGIWLDTDLLTLKRHLKDKRIEIVELIKTYSPQQLKRMGYHARFGAMDVGGWTEFFLLHEAHHFYSILRLKQEYFS